MNTCMNQLAHTIQQKFPMMFLESDQSLADYTYTKTGGPADVIAHPTNAEECQSLILFCNQHHIPWLVLGNASNVIVRDGGVEGVVILFDQCKEVHIKDRVITAEAGASLIEVSRLAAEHELQGLEFACGIPGSIGGAVYMNAGAYGGEIKDCLLYADVLTPEGVLHRYTNEEMAFSYRHSRLQETGEILLSATFLLEYGDQAQIDAIREDLTCRREDKQPLEYPSCGSVFKRPEGHYTGQLIQQAGLQGYQIGGAQVSTKHAGFIVNIDHATATDYLTLIQYIQDQIWQQFKVRLETEVRVLGRDQ